MTKREKRRYWLRLTLFTLLVSSLAAVFLLIYFVHLQLEAFVTPKRIAEVGTPDLLERPYQDIELTSPDGLTLAGWYIPGSRAEAIVLVHGIDANRRALLPQAAILAEAGFQLLLIDLRGHGQSEGAEASYGYREALDVQTAVDYLDSLPAVAHIGALGTSYGGAAVARAAAADSRIEAVVIESSYSSLALAIEDAFEDRSIFPKQFFAPILVALAERRLGISVAQVDSARDLATLQPRAVMIIHGSRDHLFPRHHAQTMYDAAHMPKELWIIDGLGHSNPIPGREDEYRQRVVGFFEAAFSRSLQTQPSF